MAYLSGNSVSHAFRTAANSPINPATDDLGTLGGTYSSGAAINNAGQVTGWASLSGNLVNHAFLYSNGTMADLGVLGVSVGLGEGSIGTAINTAGQVVGTSTAGPPAPSYESSQHAFLYSGGTMTDLNVFNPVPYTYSPIPYLQGSPNGINDSGQITGYFWIGGATAYNAYLYSGGANGTVTVLPTLGGTYQTYGLAINAAGQITGLSDLGDNYSNPSIHAFLYSNGTMTDLGTFGGTTSVGTAINTAGQVVGYSTVSGNTATDGFLYKNGVMTDLNNMLPSGSGWSQIIPTGINDSAQITGSGTHNSVTHAFLMTPAAPYKAYVHQPINADGSSIFNASKGVVPAKFTLTQNGTATCTLPAATIAVTRTAGGTLGAVDESVYSQSADSGSNFRIDSCQFVYNLNAKAFGVGTYRVDISIANAVVGSATFALK